MILRDWKILLIASLGLTLLSSACAGLKIKIYYLSAEQGLVRKQAGEVIPFAQAEGYFCHSPEDERTLIDAYISCRASCRP